MRCRNTRTDNPPRVSFCFNCEERHRNRCLIDRPNKDLYLAGRGRCPRRPEKDKDKSQNFDRKSFLNCRDRRPRLSKLVSIIKCTSVCDKTKNFYLVRRGDHRSSVCSGFAQKPLKSVILSVVELLGGRAII